jgi:8-oxo-dGTP diphosphatase
MDNKEMKNISVDCVIFGFDSNELKILLIDMQYQDEASGQIESILSLAGNHIYEDENLDDAASRILKECTGLTDIYLEQFYTFGDCNRLKSNESKLWLERMGKNPDNRVITTAFFSLVKIENVKITFSGRHAHWVNIHDVNVLAFDHKKILDKGIKALRKKLRKEPIGFELLPEKFTLVQLQNLYEAVFDKKLDKRNFRKRIQNAPYIVQLKEKETDAMRKPAQLYMFSKDIYTRTKKESNLFSI